MRYRVQPDGSLTDGIVFSMLPRIPLLADRTVYELIGKGTSTVPVPAAFGLSLLKANTSEPLWFPSR